MLGWACCKNWKTALKILSRWDSSTEFTLLFTAMESSRDKSFTHAVASQDALVMLIVKQSSSVQLKLFLQEISLRNCLSENSDVTSTKTHYGAEETEFISASSEKSFPPLCNF